VICVTDNQHQQDLLFRHGEKLAGIVLILESPKDRIYFSRLNSTTQHFGLPVDTWEMEGE
jgi:hypothetical protein